MSAVALSPDEVRADGMRLCTLADELREISVVIGPGVRPDLQAFQRGVPDESWRWQLLSHSLHGADATMVHVAQLEQRMRSLGHAIVLAADTWDGVDAWMAGWFEGAKGTIVATVGVLAVPLILGAAVAALGVAAAGVTLVAALAMVHPSISYGQVIGGATLAAQGGLDDLVTSMVNDPAMGPLIADAIDAMPEVMVALAFGPLAGPIAAAAMQFYLDDREQLQFVTLVLSAILGIRSLPPISLTLVRGSADSPPPPTTPPTSVAESLDAIPDGDFDVTIYEVQLSDGSTIYQVYANGTQDQGLGTSEEGFDNASNGLNAAGLEGSGQAVLDAMEAAGVPPGAVVQFSGYSQGGAAVLIAAGSGLYTVDRMLTFAAPIGALEPPPGTEWLAIQHEGDLVPHLNGSQTGTPAQVLSVLPPSSTDMSEPFAAHHRDTYEQTAEMLDASGDPMLVGVNQGYDELEGAVIVNVFTFVAER